MSRWEEHWGWKILAGFSHLVPVGDQLCVLIGLCSQCVQNTSPEMPKQIQRTSKVETLLCDPLCQRIGEFSMRAARIFRKCRSKSSEPVKHSQQQARSKTHECHWPRQYRPKGSFRKVDAERIIWQTSCQGSVVSEAKKIEPRTDRDRPTTAGRSPEDGSYH